MREAVPLLAPIIDRYVEEASDVQLRAFADLVRTFADELPVDDEPVIGRRRTPHDI